MLPCSTTIKTVAPLILILSFLSACRGGGGGSSNDGPGSLWLIPEKDVVDGGPGFDGIPALEDPIFESATTSTTVQAGDMVIMLRRAGVVKIFPHDIMDYHEIVNDTTATDPYTMSYCPLTGTAMAWVGNVNHANPTFGTTGLLYNSNLILYDRETRTYFSQMLQLGVKGPRIGEVAVQIPLIETSYSTALQMYPDAMVMSRDTSWNRPYGTYPYGNYLNSEGLLFPVSRTDNRLFSKTRVMGIYSDNESKVYQMSAFGSKTQTLNESFAGKSIVIIGNSDLDFAAIFDRQLADGTILSFSPVQDDLPNIMTDTEGNVWDVFGAAVSGPRAGEQLAVPPSYKGMWFAFVAFSPNPEIHFN